MRSIRLATTYCASCGMNSCCNFADSGLKRPSFSRRHASHMVSYIHTYIWTCTYLNTYIHTCIHTCMYTHIHTNKHTYIRTNIHTYTHVHIHTYIHTYCIDGWWRWLIGDGLHFGEEAYTTACVYTLFVCRCLCVYVGVYVSVCVCVCVFVLCPRMYLDRQTG